MIAGVREEALEEREAPGDAVEDQRRAVAILHAGGVDLDAQHETERVGDQMALAALDPLSGVVADHFARLRAGSDALAVDDGGGRALVAALQFPAPPVEHVVVRELRDRPAAIIAGMFVVGFFGARLLRT